MPEMTPERLARYFDGVADKMRQYSEDALELTRLDLLEKARAMSSGPLMPEDLAQMDHPYAVRHGQPRLAPEIINAPMGRFLEDWESDPVRDVGGALGVAVYNTSPEAVFLEAGTKTMFARPIADAVADAIQPRFEERCQAAIERAFS